MQTSGCGGSRSGVQKLIQKAPEWFEVDQCGLFYHLLHPYAILSSQAGSELRFEDVGFGAPVARKWDDLRSAQGATVRKTCRKKFEIELCRNELQTLSDCFRSTLLHWLKVTIVVVRSYDVSLVLRGFSCVFSFAIWVSALRISSLRTSLGVSLEIFITCPKSLLTILNALSRSFGLCLVRI